MINVCIFNYEGGNENCVREMEDISMTVEAMAEKIQTAILENKPLMITDGDGDKHVFGPDILRKSYVEIVAQK